MRALPWWASVSLLVLPLAGCIAEPTDVVRNEAADEEEPPSTVVVEPEPGVFVAENKGLVKGRVLNDASFGIPGATAILAATRHIATTDAQGAFVMENVTAGTYTLRVEKQGFSAHESDIAVVRGNVTNVTVQLVPLEERGAGSRPHLHDFWGDKTEFVIMDQDVDLTQDPGGGYGVNLGYAYWRVLSAAYYPNGNQTNPPGWPIFLPDEAIIVPGTGEIRATFTWSSSQNTMATLGLTYLSADKAEAPANYRYTPQKPSGGTHIVKVNSTMADSGHQAFTLWRFWAHAENPLPSTSNPNTNFRPAVATGSIHVTIVLVKADLYLEPAHADYWANGDALVLRAGHLATRFTFPVGQRDPFGVGAIVLPQGAIVPPGTGRMRLTLTWTYDQATPADQEHDMIWRVGNQQAKKTPYSKYHAATPTQTGPTKKVWEFAMEPSWTDAFYQKKSNWEFSVYLKPYSPEDRLYPDPRPRTVYLEVAVWKDPNYAAS